MYKSNLGVHLDVGHDSIGWCVTRFSPNDERFLAISGAGVVLFPADDCLANARRAFRRQRRHIRATRQRISRMKAMILGLGVMTSKELDANPTAAPWKLAAQVLSCNRTLTWGELWCVLRWYAHNRGYDGNALASAKNRIDADDEDIKNNVASKEMMRRYGTNSMAETMCRFLGVDPCGKQISSREYFKGNKVSFDRKLVVKEVTRILQFHKDRLPGVTDEFIHMLVADPLENRNFLHLQSGLPFRIQNRYWGGVLFGQLAPRFDNRIIGVCPVSGKKLPSKTVSEFFEYRWAMMLANVVVGNAGRSLSVEEIGRLNEDVLRAGGYSKAEFKKLVVSVTGETVNNLDGLLATPEADASLVRFPGVHALCKKGLREVLDDRDFRKFANILFKGKRLPLKDIAHNVSGSKKEAILALANLQCEKGRPKRKGAAKKSIDDIMSDAIAADLPSGRSPYSREVMREAAKSVFEGRDPRKSGGLLYRDCTKADILKTSDIDKETNNHLIRHRVKILLRLLKDIVRDYAENNPAQVAQVTIEMARDLKDLSGMTNKQIVSEMLDKTRQHQKAAKMLAKHLKIDERLVSPGLIRKVRIAEDMNWTCPYTGAHYDIQDIVSKSDHEPGCVDKDHILPRSERATDSLDSLVLTYTEVNRMKEARTGLAFVRECAGMRVPGKENLVIVNETEYKKTVEGLKLSGHADDRKRQKRRKLNLLRLRSDEAGMTEGMLTRTSHITALATKAIRGYFENCGRMPEIVSIPGRVTAVLRNKWNLLGILAETDGRVKDESGRLRLKQEIREITHMHHAVDAITLGLAATLLPRDGTFWALMCKRRVKESEKAMLQSTGVFRFSVGNEPQLVELPEYLRSAIKAALDEKRVVVHQPQERAGLKVKQNIWGIEAVESGFVSIRQRARDENTGRISVKRDCIPVGKAFGLNPSGVSGKLKAIKGVLLPDGNYGVALVKDNPVVIRHQRVWGALADLKEKNGGRMPEILRRNDLIKVETGGYAGIWRVASVKDNKDGLALDIIVPFAVKPKSGVSFAKINVNLKTLMVNRLKVLKTCYTGVSICPITSLTSQRTM